MGYDVGVITCNDPGCEETIPNHRWGKIKSGWCFMKNGNSFCPKHTPSWAKKK